MNKKIIGLCGGSGSGKGTVGNFFSECGYLVIDTDKVYREMIDKPSDCLDALVAEFGTEILSSTGVLDRRKLASIVFSDKKKHKVLNEITHKFVLQRVREIIKICEEEYIGTVVDAPMLFESGFDKECDFVIAVLADEKTRIDRIVVRDNLSHDAATERINSQIPDSELRKRADFSIINDADLNSLKMQVKHIIEKII